MQFPSVLTNKKTWLLLGLIIVYIKGLFLDIMEVDAAQYASISMEMLKNGQFLQVMHRGSDYLDKPPLLFWLSALSFKLFGINNWAYKLPSFLSALLGIYGIYKFSLLFYSRTIAENAAFILASSLGLLLITNDVRTDTMLLGMTACAIWQVAVFIQTNKWRSLLGAAIFIGLAMLTKGPIGLVLPCFATGTHLILRRDWKNLFKIEWLWLLLLVGLILLPMCWGLYQQFDLHPEKALNDRKTSSGLYFYFWEQSFGRVTGENVWHDDSTPFYFLHTYLWAFLPWAIFFAVAMPTYLIAFGLQKFRFVAKDEAFTLGGFLLTFIAMSLSNYKLPHYVFVTLPFASVLTARYLAQLFAPNKDRTGFYNLNMWSVIYGIIWLIMGVLAFSIPSFIFFSKNILIWIGLFSTFGFLIYCVYKKPVFEDSNDFISKNLIASLGLGFVLNFCFYPNLLDYQGTAKMGKIIANAKIDPAKIGFFKSHGHALDFYARGFVKKVNTISQIQKAQTLHQIDYVYTDKQGKMKMDSAQVNYYVQDSVERFSVTRLNGTFLNPTTRDSALNTVFLLKLLPSFNDTQKPAINKLVF
jgi:4-amino-4-deoxy-L-arabinose transferase-like glycosyltransferase